jgi:peptidoglycan/LPS O-acetylase OafA/YrhL
MQMNPFQGGYIGVDVFFVISGYLIAGILLNDLSRGRFSFIKFYERRARRILPALFLVMVVTIPFAWLWMLPRSFKDFSQSIVAITVFLSNIFFCRESGYFAEPNELKPLLHTWSLAVEEQFYVLFPLLLLICWRYFRQRLTLVMLIGIALSFVTASWSSWMYQTADFYLSPTRGWELLVGCVLAKLEHEHGRESHPMLNSTLPLVGLFGIALAVVLFGPNTPHPGIPTALPVLGTAAFIWFGGGPDIASRVLSSRIIVGIGLISYSLYLWHQPVFAFARIYSLNAPTASTYVALIVVCLALSFLTFKLVEKPFRDRARVSSTAVWTAAALTGSLLLTFGLWGHFANGVGSRFPAFVLTLEHIRGGYVDLDGDNCRTKPRCIIGDKSVAPSIALIGDSHAMTLKQSLDYQLRKDHVSAIVFTTGDIYLDVFPRFYPDHDRLNQILASQKEQLRDKRLATIILAGRYVLKLENANFDNGEGGIDLNDSWNSGWSEEQRSVLKHLYTSSVEGLLNQGKRVVLIYPVPEVGWNVPDQLAKLLMRAKNPLISTSYQRYRERSKGVIDAFDAIENHPRLVRVFPDGILCNTFIANRCATHTQSEVFYHDDNHLSVDGANLVVREMFRAMESKWGDWHVGPAENAHARQEALKPVRGTR